MGGPPVRRRITYLLAKEGGIPFGLARGNGLGYAKVLETESGKGRLMRVRKGMLAAGVLLTFLAVTGCGGAAPTKKESPPPASQGTPPAGQGQGQTSPPKPAEGEKPKMQWDKAPEMKIDVNKQYFATLKTNKGDIKVELLAKESPKTVNNFVFLAREKFYDGVIFHRVIKTFMVQTGDPTGTGRGGPGYRFEDELPPKHSYDPGIVAMANSGPNTNGSQFFICSGTDCRNLNAPQYAKYNQFGKVVAGMDVLGQIAGVPVGPGNPGENSRPQQEVKILSIAIEEK